MVRAPLVLRLPRVTAVSSVTSPVETPPITGTSLVPWMVTVTIWLAVPSEETAVKLSVMDWPAPSCWKVGRASWGGRGQMSGGAGGVEKETGLAGGGGWGGEMEGALSAAGVGGGALGVGLPRGEG